MLTGPAITGEPYSALADISRANVKTLVLWSRKLDGALDGEVITYRVNGVQRVAVAAGMTSPAWPTENTTAKILVLGVAA